MWVCFGRDRPLFSAEMIEFLSGVERDRGVKSPQIVLRNIAALHSLSQEIAAADACLSQPQSQQPYWEWCRNQGLPYNQFDVLQNNSVIPNVLVQPQNYLFSVRCGPPSPSTAIALEDIEAMPIHTASLFEPQHHHGQRVAICRTLPSRAEVDRHLKFLAPPASLLWDYKQWQTSGEVAPDRLIKYKQRY